MDLANIYRLLSELEKKSTSKDADASLTIKRTELHCYFRPLGWGVEHPSVLAYGNTPEEAIEKATKDWEEMSSRVQKAQLQKLALAIIRITHDNGRCTDAALRAEFSVREIEALSEQALKLANEMADNGPFEILELAGANAA